MTMHDCRCSCWNPPVDPIEAARRERLRIAETLEARASELDALAHKWRVADEHGHASNAAYLAASELRAQGRRLREE